MELKEEIGKFKKEDIEKAKKEVLDLFEKHPELAKNENKNLLLYAYLAFGKETINQELDQKYNRPKLDKFNFPSDIMFLQSIKYRINIQGQMNNVYVLSVKSAGKRNPNTGQQEKRIINFWVINEKKIASSWVNEEYAVIADGLKPGLYNTRYNISKDGRILLSSPISFQKLDDQNFKIDEIIDSIMSTYSPLEPPYEIYFGEDGNKFSTVYFSGMLLPTISGFGFNLIDGKNDEKIIIYPPKGTSVHEQDYVFGFGDIQYPRADQDEYRIFAVFITILQNNEPIDNLTDNVDNSIDDPF